MVNKKGRINSAKTAMGKVVAGGRNVVADFSLRLRRGMNSARTRRGNGIAGVNNPVADFSLRYT